MKFEDISIPALQGFRPRPIRLTSSDGRVLILLTCWGDSSMLEKIKSIAMSAVENIDSKSSSSVEDPDFDPDATRVGLTPLKPEVHRITNLQTRLKIAVEKINDFLITHVNNAEWNTCVEVVMLGLETDYLYWAQVGQPNIFRTTDSGIEPISYSPDMTLDFDQKIPLPFQALGFSKEYELRTGMLPAEKLRKIIFLSTPNVPAGLYISMSVTIESIAGLVQQTFPDAPAWVALIDPHIE